MFVNLVFVYVMKHGLMYNVKKQKINVEIIIVMEQDHVLLKKINLFVSVIY